VAFSWGSLFVALVLGCGTQAVELPEEDGDGCRDVGSCTGNSECGDGMLCDNGRCTRVRCLEAEDPCQSNEVCAAGECVRNGASSVCWAGLRPSGFACTDTAQCGPGLECDVALWICSVPRGLTNGSRCSLDSDCRSNFCLPCSAMPGTCATPATEGGNCCPTSTTGCQTGLICMVRDTTRCTSLSGGPASTYDRYMCAPPRAQGAACCGSDGECAAPSRCLSFGADARCSL